MDFPYSQKDFVEKNNEVWLYINGLSLQSVYDLIQKFDDKNIKSDLMRVFNERLRWSTIPEAAELLVSVRRRFSLENYFLEQELVKKIVGSQK